VTDTPINEEVCPVCDGSRSECVYLRYPDLNVTERFFVNDEEVTEAEYVAAERRAGFNNTLGHPEKPATGAFSNGAITGRTEQRV
jgi:hypothetical protein